VHDADDFNSLLPDPVKHEVSSDGQGVNAAPDIVARGADRRMINE